MRYSVFCFGVAPDDPGPLYDTLLSCARWADDAGWEAIWLPERHLHEFGGPYPAPAVLAGAIAVRTGRLGIRAGSVVTPLHHPLRVAESWSVVDNLSGGRVGLAFASGWHRQDFLLSDRPYAERGSVTRERMAAVRALWRGESLTLHLPDGDAVNARLYPEPIQAELPVWIATGGSLDSARAAGAVGANLLTHLLGQEFETLAQTIRAYREAYLPSPGGPARGTVTLMVHTLVGEDGEATRERARPHLARYLELSAELQLRSLQLAQGGPGPAAQASDLRAVADGAMAALLGGRSLVGSVQECLRVASLAEESGVDELACLLDFVDDPRTLLDGLPWLAKVSAG